MEQQYCACPSCVYLLIMIKRGVSGSVFWHVLLSLALYRRSDTIREMYRIAQDSRQICKP